MELTYGNQTVNFYEHGAPETIPLSLSGGLDSASLFYLVSKHFPESQVVPFSCRDLQAPLDADAANDITRWMQAQFPKNKIQDIQIFDFDAHTEKYVTNEEVDQVIAEEPRFTGMRRTQVSKMIQIDNISIDIMRANPGSVRLDGMTRNPPTNEMKDQGFFDKAERRRDKELPHMNNWILFPLDKYPPYAAYNNIYKPYLNVDKKFVAGVFIENNLMDTLYPLTRSCVGTVKETKNFTKECGHCFWCHEKKWAFKL